MRPTKTVQEKMQGPQYWGNFSQGSLLVCEAQSKRAMRNLRPDMRITPLGRYVREVTTYSMRQYTRQPDSGRVSVGILRTAGDPPGRPFTDDIATRPPGLEESRKNWNWWVYINTCMSCAESCNYVSEMPRHWPIPLDFILHLCQISPARCSQLSIAFCKSKVDSSHGVGPTLQMVNTGEKSQ